MRTLHVIGIGAGAPGHVTVEAVEAMAATDVFLLLDKPGAADELTDARQALLDRFVPGTEHRVVRADDVERDRAARDYAGAVDDWRTRRAELYERLLRAEVPDGATAAILVWGDPTLYDSTVTVVDEVLRRGNVALEWTVVPGISSVAALVAAHRVPLNRVGRPVQITPARRVRDGGWPAGVDDVVVMLDAWDTFASLTGAETADVDIYWGAYLGTPDEILVSGPVDEVAAEIRRVRAEARERKGWVMDTYLLRRRS